MRSHLFSKHDLKETERFVKDLSTLFSLKEDVLGRLPEYAFQSLAAPTTRETEDVYDRASQDLGVPRAEFDHALDIAQFFLREIAPKGDATSDTPEDLVSDMVEIYGLSEDKRQVILRLLARLRTIAQEKVEAILLERGHAQSILPRVGSISVAVDFRSVFDEYFKSNKEVSEFTPRFRGIIPLGIVTLGLIDGPTEQVHLQFSKRTLQILIDHLLALQKQIDEAEKNISVKGE